MPDYLERFYWGPNADSRLGPSLDEPSSIWTKPHCMTRPDEQPSMSYQAPEDSDTLSENSATESSARSEGGFSPAQAAAIAGVAGIAALGLVWLATKAVEKVTNKTFERR